MAHISDLIATDIDQYLRAHEHKSLLRFITCGSVDDGKSTLIGRLPALAADGSMDGVDKIVGRARRLALPAYCGIQPGT